MLALLVVSVVVVTVAGFVGGRLVHAGRQVELQRPTKLDARLHRTRAAVETLVMPETEAHELRPSAGAHQLRAQTYSVLGLGLLGVAAVLAIGVLLVL